VSGKHEPVSKRSFYYSLSTAALRGILVITALVLGVFVLSKAFPTAGEVTLPEDGQQQPTDGGSPTVPATDSPQPSPDSSPVEPQDPDPFEGIVVAVRNGTDVSGLAAETALFLQRRGVDVPDEEDGGVGDASDLYDQTTIFYRPEGKDAAEELQARWFQNALLERAPADSDPNFDVTIVLGADFAAEQDAA
jgi:hypothetical protein